MQVRIRSNDLIRVKRDMLPLAGVGVPVGIVLRPEWGALFMAASSVIVVTNALLMRRQAV